MNIWIDFDNAPHVHFFAPIIEELRRRGIDSILTVRAFGQTEELARSYGMNFTVIGEHRMPRTKLGRIAATLERAEQLADHGRKFRPAAAVSHGSRSLTMASWLLRIPSMVLYDYEFVSTGVFNRLARRVLVPEVVTHSLSRISGASAGKLMAYPGFKEEVYIYDFQPQAAVPAALELDLSRLVVTVRPPATWAHYHNRYSVILFRALVERLRRESGAQVLVLARTRDQAEELSRTYGLSTPPFRVLHHAVDGLSLMWYSDAVFSGGGTMVREAALLGVNAYSTFAGKQGAVDTELERLGKLTILRRPEQIERLTLAKRLPATHGGDGHRPRWARDFIVQQLLELAYGQSPKFTFVPGNKTCL